MVIGTRRLKVSIDGETYIVVGTKSDEHVKAASQLVTKQLQQLKQKSPQLTEKDKAILLALNTMSKQLTLEQDILQLKRKIKQLETALDDAKNPERLLMKKTSHKEENSTIAEQLTLDDLYKEETNLFKQDNKYIPAIHRKDQQQSLWQTSKKRS